MENTQQQAGSLNVNPALLERDYTVIIDQSGSMSYPVSQSQPNGPSRWVSAEEAVRAAAVKLNELDPDGITVYTFEDSFKRFDNTTPQKVADIFAKQQPGGSTALAEVLDDAFRNYLDRKANNKAKKNGELIVVATDGVPNNGEAVARVITNCTKQLGSANELHVIFLQVGDDAKAGDYLESLDDDLVKAGAKWDIVSTLPVKKLGGKGLTQALLDAITEHKIVA